jgi:hypothetical protein
MSADDVRAMESAADARGIRLIGHTDLNGHGDAMQVNLKDGYAFVGHMGATRVGTSIVDARDPRAPQVVKQIDTPPGTHSHKVQIVGDILVVNYERNLREFESPTWGAGLKVFDVATPTDPREIGFFSTPGRGVHRMTYWEDPFVIMSASVAGYNDQIVLIADLTDPAHPVEAGRWGLPGMEGPGTGEMWRGHGDRVSFHHAIIRGDRAYCGFRDAGLVILDISSIASPQLVAHLDFGAESKTTHTAFPVPGRDLLVVTDESTSDNCKEIPRHVRMVDISTETAPKVVSRFPVPQGDFCTRGGRFGPHNVHEMPPGSFQSSEIVHLTYFNAGLRILDISDPASPTEVAHYIPPAPPGQPAIQFNDVLVTNDGLIYVTDRINGGLYILESDI